MLNEEDHTCAGDGEANYYLPLGVPESLQTIALQWFLFCNHCNYFKSLNKIFHFSPKIPIFSTKS
jgi:hypothetical protein